MKKFRVAHILFWCLVFSFACTKAPPVDRLVKPDQERLLVGASESVGIPRIEKIFVYGDSLSDAGGLAKATFGLYAPSSVYYKNRFSNGPIWIDYVASVLKAEVFNYAVGGAETSEKAGFKGYIIPGTDKQIASSQDDLKGTDLRNSLAVLWVGSNNYFYYVRDNVEITVADIKKQILQLKEFGFNTIVVGTMPNVDGLPFNPYNPDDKPDSLYQQFSKNHHRKLNFMLDQLRDRNPELRLVTFDAYQMNRRTIERPLLFGFSNVSEPCFKGNYRGEFHEEVRYCTKPMAHKYWDYVHPNSKMHCYYAVQFLNDLSSSFEVNFDLHQAINRCKGLGNMEIGARERLTR